MRTNSELREREQAKTVVRDKAFLAFRRGFRLRRWAEVVETAKSLHRWTEACGPDDPFRPLGFTHDQIRFTILSAAEAALLGQQRAEDICDWLYLHAIPGRVAELNQARQENADNFAEWFPQLSASQLQDVRNQALEPPIEASDAPPPEAAHARITVRPDTLTDQVSKAEVALLAAGYGLYQRAGEIVRAGYVAAPGGKEMLQISPIDEIHLAELMGRAVEWQRYDARSKTVVPCRCPPDVAKAYLSRGTREWRLPHVTSIVEAPTLRADGTLITIPGHDEATGLLYDCRDEDHPYVSDRVILEDAEEAADTLLELLAEFPFLEDADQAVALAAILTAVVRRALPAAPLFGFTAPAPGTGKSCLVDVIHMIATGRPAAALTWTGDAAEDRKQIDAALLEGAPALAFDNVTGLFGGDRLNQILTQPRASLRVLGQSRNVEVACQALVTANGNNLSIAADMTRRTVLCRLDANVERPELRTFTADPLALIRADRGRYLAAAITVLRAYHLAGRPGRPSPLGSFEAWSSWVRGAVMWVGLADPVSSMDAVRENDPTRSDHLAVLDAWDATFGGRPVSVTDLQVASLDVTGNAGLRNALLAVAGVNGTINTRRLGFWLREKKGQIVGTMKLEAGGRSKAGTSWALRGGRAGPTAAVVALVREAV